MIDPEIKNYIDQTGQQNRGFIPYHIHNGIDSPKIPSGFQTGNFEFLGGSPNKITISNPFITINSIIIHSLKAIGGTVGNVTYTTTGRSATFFSSSSTDVSSIDYIITN